MTPFRGRQVKHLPGELWRRRACVFYGDVHSTVRSSRAVEVCSLYLEIQVHYVQLTYLLEEFSILCLLMF